MWRDSVQCMWRSKCQQLEIPECMHVVWVCPCVISSKKQVRVAGKWVSRVSKRLEIPDLAWLQVWLDAGETGLSISCWRCQQVQASYSWVWRSATGKPGPATREQFASCLCVCTWGVRVRTTGVELQAWRTSVSWCQQLRKPAQAAGCGASYWIDSRGIHSVYILFTANRFILISQRRE